MNYAPYTLKDGSTVLDPRLDRLVHFDERSKLFMIREQVGDKPWRNRLWRCLIWLDQGEEGACVGFGIAHELACTPSEVKGLSNGYARTNIYWPAQHDDPWAGGAYPGAVPFYEGTAVLSGIKVAHSLGFFREYRWCFGLQDLILAVGYNGPVVIGVNWYTGMFKPDSDGFIHVTGTLAGGHCCVVRGVRIDNRYAGGGYFVIRNSWGRAWGRDGDCYITFADMEKLLHEDGEAAVFIGRKTVDLTLAA